VLVFSCSLLQDFSLQATIDDKEARHSLRNVHIDQKIKLCRQQQVWHEDRRTYSRFGTKIADVQQVWHEDLEHADVQHAVHDLPGWR